MDTLTLTIQTPERDVVKQRCSRIIARGRAGYFTLLPHHVRFMSSLRVSELIIQPVNESDNPQKETAFFIAGGILFIEKNRVRIFTRASEPVKDIDKVRAQSAKERAEKKVREETEKVCIERAQAALERAFIRLRIVQKWRRA